MYNHFEPFVQEIRGARYFKPFVQEERGACYFKPFVQEERGARYFKPFVQEERGAHYFKPFVQEERGARYFRPFIQEERGARYFRPFIQEKILYPEPFYSGNVRCVCNLLFNRKYYSTEHFVQEMYIVFVTFCLKENTTVLNILFRKCTLCL